MVPCIGNFFNLSAAINKENKEDIINNSNDGNNNNISITIYIALAQLQSDSHNKNKEQNNINDKKNNVKRQRHFFSVITMHCWK